MATMLHPQTLFCYEMYGQPLDRGHGAPLRLQMPTKLGYKQAKYLDTIRVTNVLKAGKRGYWEDQGYELVRRTVMSDGDHARPAVET